MNTEAGILLFGWCVGVAILGGFAVVALMA